MSERTAELAVGWIEAWAKYDMEWLRQRLAPDFVHVSPLGRYDGRDNYLAEVEPMARKSVSELSVKDVIASGNQAAVLYENTTPKGVVEACDWVRVEGDAIQEIRGFYDASSIREILGGSD